MKIQKKFKIIESQGKLWNFVWKSGKSYRIVRKLWDNPGRRLCNSSRAQVNPYLKGYRLAPDALRLSEARGVVVTIDKRAQSPQCSAVCQWVSLHRCTAAVGDSVYTPQSIAVAAATAAGRARVHPGRPSGGVFATFPNDRAKAVFRRRRKSVVAGVLAVVIPRWWWRRWWRRRWPPSAASREIDKRRLQLYGGLAWVDGPRAVSLTRETVNPFLFLSLSLSLSLSRSLSLFDHGTSTRK